MAEVKRLVEDRHGAIDVLKTWLPRVALAMVFVSVSVLILKDGRVAGHDSVMNLRSTLRLPSLDAVFAAMKA